MEKEDKFRLPPSGEAPWLVYTHETDDLIQTFCPISPLNPFYITSIPELCGRSICASCHGWLILRDRIDMRVFSLWNPVTTRFLPLPPLPVDDIDTIDVDGDECFTLITSNVGNADNNDGVSINVCVVLLFFKELVYTYRLDSTRVDFSCGWVSHSVELDGEILEVHEIIAVNKVVYGWARTEVLYEWLLFSLEVANDASNSLTIKSLKMDPPRSGIGCVHSVDYWVECCGCIYYVSAFIRHRGDHRISKVKVMELDLVGKKWVEVKSLNGRAFFVGKDCSMWCWGSNNTSSNAGGGGSGNVRGDCVYFVTPEMEDTIFYCYSLHECSLGVFLSCPELEIPFNNPVWFNVMPHYHRLLGVQNVKGQEWNETKKDVDDEVSDHGMICSSTKYKKEHLSQGKERQRESLLFTELPDHLINLISKYMHLFDFWNFRASCKTFQSVVAPAPQRRTKSMFPLFVFLKNDGRMCELKDPSRDDSCSSSFQLSSDPFAIDYFKDGWLVISVGPEKSLKYFNPFTREKGNFPNDVSMSGYSSVGFSTYPTSPDCLTITVVDRILSVEINYIRYGDEKWDGYEFRHEGEHEFHPGTSSPVYFAGRFYILDKSGYLGAFSLVDGEVSWRIYDRPYVREHPLYSSHLVECGGELHALFIGYMGMFFEMFKFNLHEEKWFEVRSLGNHSLFLSETSSFSVETTEVGMQNRIYLSRLKRNGIIFYSLETEKYYICGSDESWDDFYDTKVPMQCCWL